MMHANWWHGLGLYLTEVIGEAVGCLRVLRGKWDCI